MGQNIVITISDSPVQMDWKTLTKNIVDVNIADHTNRIEQDFKANFYRPLTDKEFKDKVKAKKDNRNIQIQKQIDEGGEGVIY